MQTAKLSRVVPWRGLDVHGAVEASRMNPSAARVSRRNAASTAMTVGVLVAFGVMAWVPSPLAGACRGIGRCAFVAGDNVHVIDPHGLAEPMAARLELTHRGIPGHEK